MARSPWLTGPRVTVRMPRESDIPSILHFFARNREFFAATDPPRPENFYTESFWRVKVTEVEEAFRRDRSCLLFVFDQESALIGMISLSELVRGAFQACYLGYLLDERSQGKGFMSEALRLVIDFAFRDWQIHRLMANYMPTNEKSGRLLRRLGFAVEGYARDYLFINGEWRDHVLTSLTNPAQAADK